MNNNKKTIGESYSSRETLTQLPQPKEMSSFLRSKTKKTITNDKRQISVITEDKD